LHALEDGGDVNVDPVVTQVRLEYDGDVSVDGMVDCDGVRWR
jgi:hypothetical protein